MADGRVVIDVQADDKQFRGVMSSLGSVAAAGVKAAAVGVATLTATVIGFGVAGLKASTEFNKGMANVASLIPGNTARVEELKRTVSNMAVQFGKDTGDLTDGLYQVVSAFGDTSDTAKIMETNVKAATAGVATTTDAINLTSAVTKAYGDTSAEAVEKASDLALMTVRLGQTSFPELAGSIGKVTPLTNELGVSQEELFASMATLTGVTGAAAEVSTQLRGAMQSLMAPTDGATAAIKAAGYEDAKAMLAKEGFAGSMKILTDAAEASGKPLQSYISSIEGQTLALALAGPQADTYAAKLKEMESAGGATDAAFKEQTEGINALGFAFDQLEQVGVGSLQKLGDAIGNAFGPDIIASVGEVDSALDALMSGISDTLSGDAAGGAEQIQAGLQTMIDILADGIVTMVPVIVSAVAGLIVAVASALPEILPPVGTALIDGLLTLVNTLPTIIPPLLTAVVGVVTALINAIPTMLPALVTATVQLFMGIVTALPTLVVSLVNALVGAIPILIQGAVQLFTAIGQAYPIVMPQLITALLDGINSLVAMLPTLIPVILEAAIALLMGMLQAMPLVTIALLDGMVTLITTIVDMLPDLIPMLLEAAIVLFLAMVEAAPVIMPKLMTAITDLIIKVVMLLPTLIPALLRAAIALFTALVDAAPKVSAALIEAVTKLGQQARDVLPTFVEKFKSAGKDMIAGIIDGVKDSVGALKDAVKEAAQKALGAAKDLLGINSPSKAFRDVVGAGIIEGVELGVRKNARHAIAAVRDTARAMVDEARSSLAAQALAVSPGFVPAAGAPRLGGPALAYGAVGSSYSSSSSLEVNFIQPVRSYSETVRAIRDAQRAAARR